MKGYEVHIGLLKRSQIILDVHSYERPSDADVGDGNWLRVGAAIAGVAS
jgi:hypothetical protein